MSQTCPSLTRHQRIQTRVILVNKYKNTLRLLSKLQSRPLETLWWTQIEARLKLQIAFHWRKKNVSTIFKSLPLHPLQTALTFSEIAPFLSKCKLKEHI